MTDDSHVLPRRFVLIGAAALVPGLILGARVSGVAAAASPISATEPVQGAFSAAGYTWPVAGTPESAAGVLFALTAGGRPVVGRRVRFSISASHALGRSLWFEAEPENTPAYKAAGRLGYLDLDTDASGAVPLDRWLRLGDVPTAAIGQHPMLRAQLVGSETVLASVRLGVV